MRSHEDYEFCGHCQKETLHLFTNAGKERDSSQDRAECLECHWYRYDYEGEYQPPIIIDDEDD